MALFPDTNSGWSPRASFEVSTSQVQIENLPEKGLVTVQTTAERLAGATTIPIAALSTGLASGERVLFSSENVVAVLTAPAAANATSLTVSALSAPVRTGSVGRTTATDDVAYAAKTRTITFNGQTTTALSYTASAATIQTALEALSNIAPGDVIVSGVAPNLVYTFAGAYLGKAVPTLVAKNAAGTVLNFFETVVGGVSAQGVAQNRRSLTQDRLSARGFRRGSGQVQNDLETMRQRKPRDIGQVGRDPFEK